MSDTLERARTLLRLRRPEAAERELREILARDPQQPMAHALLAYALTEVGSLDAALAAANEAVRLSPDHWYPHYVAALVLRRRDRPHDALHAARTALAIDPTRPSAWELVSRIHMSLHEWWPAAQAAQEGLRHDPQDSALTSLLSVSLAEVSGAPGALAAAAEAVRLDPETPLPHIAYGRAALAGGDPRTAAEAFREALRLDPGWTPGRWLLLLSLKLRNPCHRILYRLAGLREASRGRVLLTLALGAVIPLVTLLVLLLTLGFWALAVTETYLALRLRADPRHRDLIGRAERRAAGISVTALGSGAVLLGAGAALSLPGVGYAGAALLALPVPVQESLFYPRPRGRAILWGWTALLAVPIAVGVALSPFPATADAAVVTGGFAMLAALFTVWPAVLAHPRPPK
ncbi:tetratricopeptide repeat protein [Actinomadura craniellae]|uniref:tetratricopeptide repeat protein n=1 Tax=Actinomadura craniellae TaxID=2231787 RepID=UPI0013146DE7|nr:tetratricopeptide repeat protein [Actinomadura craniellae]